MQTITPPVWAAIQPKDLRFVRGEVLVAGYTLTDFQNADTDDWAPVIQALLDRLAEEGGGALYIPEGEYVCRTPVTVPSGVTLVGDWEKPDGKSPVVGTVLSWCGAAASEKFDTPFITVEPNAVVRDLAFWYPAQSEANPTPYPPTVRLSYWNVAKEITFINAWVGIEEVAGDSPSMYDVYGTALSVGILDRVVTDIMRIEDTRFSPDYWLHSGKFHGDETILRRLLYTTAVGVYLERTDWSYYTESSVDGYCKGVVFNSYGCYGQNYDLHIQNCRYGIYVNFTHGNGQELTRVVIENCEYGVYAPADGVFGAATMHDVTIHACREAIGLHCPGKFTFVDSVIEEGTVAADNAMLAVVNATFAAQTAVKVEIGGTASVLLAGNVGLEEAHVRTDGEACTYRFNAQTVPGAVSSRLNAKQAAAAKTLAKRPRNAAVYSADRLSAALGYTLDNTGTTDATAALNACLQKAGESGGALYLPSGHYRITAPIAVPADVELLGAIDCARVPHNVGTVIDVDFENGHAVNLSSRSGLRGITFAYVGQTAVWLYENGAPREYDYTIYAKDAPDVYVINVASYNCYRGVLLDGCDRHYVEGVGGAFLYRGVEVRRAADGIVRDCQFNIQALFRCYGWPREIAYRYNDLPEDALRPLAMHFFDMLQGECQTYVLDSVTDEMVYGCFTYGGGKTLVIKGENTTATMIGYASDTVRQSVDVQGGREITMINTQMAPYTPKEYTNREFTEVYGVHLHDTFKGVVNMINSETWARPRVMFKVDGGILNVYNDNAGCGSYEGESHVKTVTLVETAEGAKVQISALLQYHPSLLIEDDTVVNGGFCGTTRLIGAENMMRSTECYE